jgi:DNA (cytosine-5)-methyltransferase 1
MVRGDVGASVQPGLDRPLAFGGNNTAGAIDVATAVTAVTAHGGPHGRCDFESETFVAQDVAHALRAEGFDASEDGTGRGTPLVPHCFDARQSDVLQYGNLTGPLDTDGHTMAVAFGSKDHGADAEVELAPTLRAGGHAGSHANAGVPPAVAFALRGREGGAVPEVEGDGQNVGALRAANGGSSRDYVAGPLPFDTTQITSPTCGSNPQPGDPCHTLSRGQHPPAIAGLSVRRLTPRECERLQGFPDDYTLIPWRGGMAPDGPRYKALGNSMAVPVMRWIGERIALVDAMVQAGDRDGAAA